MSHKNEVMLIIFAAVVVLVLGNLYIALAEEWACSGLFCPGDCCPGDPPLCNGSGEECRIGPNCGLSDCGCSGYYCTVFWERAGIPMCGDAGGGACNNQG